MAESRSASEQITDEVTSWPGVKAGIVGGVVAVEVPQRPASDGEAELAAAP